MINFKNVKSMKKLRNTSIKIGFEFGKANEEELYGVEFAHRVNAR